LSTKKHFCATVYDDDDDDDDGDVPDPKRSNEFDLRSDD
jgi:hypothetical protein